jgi:predicted amidohydrolase YtcJ
MRVARNGNATPNKCVVGLLVALILLTGCQRKSPAEQADLILVNGKILTVDAADSVAQAVAIRGGKILAVGSNEEVRALAAKDARVIDLHGRTATPGLIDTHCHFDESGAIYSIDLSDAAKLDDVLQRVREKAASLKPGEWITGGGWDEGKLAERRLIQAADLDKAAPQNPVWLFQTMGHYGTANSAAMKLAKIASGTKNPEAGTIDHDASGKPTGVLKEAAMDLVTQLIPPLSKEQQRNGILKMMEDFNKEGMTGAKDPGIEPEKWELYRELQQQGKMSVRIFALLLGGKTMDSAEATLSRLNALPRPPASFGDGMLLAGGIKMYMDGSGGARTAWVSKEWNKNSKEKDTGNFGYPALDPEMYRQIVKLFHDAGIHVSTHAVGDRAIDWVVDTYDGVLKAKPTQGLRHGIIHANIPSDHAIDTMARLQKDYDAGYPESQSTFTWWIGDTYAGNFGPERALRLMPFATYLKKGVKWGGGSDYFVTPFPARYGLWASVERKALKGTWGAQPFGTAESVDIHAALRSYTIWAAHQMFLESRVGSIETGKDADIAVWDRNLYSVPSAELKDLKCELTLVAGKVVFEKP